MLYCCPLAPGTIKRGQQIRLVVAAFDGEEQGPESEAVARVRNSPPSAPQVSIEPAKPTIADALECVVQKPASDPDGEAPRLRLAWLRDGKPVPMGAEQTRLAAGTARHGETWRCEIVATDGELSSVPAGAEVKIGNSTPSAPSAIVEPESPRAGDDLRCRLSAPASDADEDALAYQFSWKEGGKPVQAAAEEPWKLAAASVRKGHTYTCEVVPADQQSRGPAATADSSLRNSPPGAPRVELAPREPAPDDKLTCRIAEPAVDPDGDKVSYRFLWWKNGDQQSFAQSTSEVPARLLKVGDTWRCAVVGADAEAEGPLTTSDDTTVRPRASASR